MAKKINYNKNYMKTRKNAIVEYLDYHIPVTQLKGPKGKRRYASSKARLGRYASNKARLNNICKQQSETEMRHLPL